ncbi:MAG: hypothetical protein ACFFAU_12020 [Candidatus Hodarchaeota archaeon]
MKSGQRSQLILLLCLIGIVSLIISLFLKGLLPLIGINIALLSWLSIGILNSGFDIPEYDRVGDKI